MRLTKGRIIGGAVTLVLLAATGTAWWVAADARTPAQQAAESAAPDDSVITANVEERELLELLELDGELQRADELKVTAPGGGGEEGEGNSGQALVSKLPTKKGDKVNPGAVLIEINGRPYFALQGAIPAYRDLVEGDKGPDVEQLQKALSPLFGTPVTGTFDARTASDVVQLYQNAGYQPSYQDADEPEPTGDEEDDAPSAPAQKLGLPQSEVFFAPELPLTVGKLSAQLAAPAEGDLISLVSGKWQVVVELDEKASTELIQLKESTPFVYGSGPLEDKETEFPSIEEVEAEEESEDSWYDDEESGATEIAVFEVPGKVEAEPGAGQSVYAVTVQSPEGALVVPASAVWTSSDGTERVTVYDGTVFTDIEIETHVTYNGEVAVTPVDDDLSDGDEVVVAKRDQGGE